MSAHESPDPIDVEVGARILVKRKGSGVSQSGLAEALGLSFQQVQKYERGANRVSASTLVRIAAKLETTVGALIGEDAEDRQSHDTYAKLSMPGALELIHAFAKLPNAETRRAVVALVRTLAPEPPDNDAA